MSKMKFSTNDQLDIAAYIAEVGGQPNNTDSELWEIVEAIDFDALKSIVFLEDA